MLTPPEIRRISHKGEKPVDLRAGFLRRTDDDRSTAGSGCIFQHVSGTALSGIHTAGKGIASHAGTYQAHSHGHGFRPGFAGKFSVRSRDSRTGSDCLGDHRSAGLHRVRVRFRTDPDRPQFLRIDLCPFDRIAAGFDRHGDNVLVKTGDGFFFDQTFCPVMPDPSDL